jgi:hypothetical protein
MAHQWVPLDEPIQPMSFEMFERQCALEGHRDALKAIYKSLYQQKYRMEPTQHMMDFEHQNSLLAKGTKSKYFAITLNPKPEYTTNEAKWAKFLEWVHELPHTRSYLTPKEFEFHVEERPGKGPESRHIHLIVSKAYNRSPQTVAQSLGRNKYFGSYKHVYVRHVTSKEGWLEYIRKEA